MYLPKIKTVSKILIATFIWLLNSCSPLGEPVDTKKSDNHYYNKSKSDIQYSPMGNWFEIQNTAMNADVESFEVLSRHLSRDKNRFYFEAYAITNPSFDINSVYLKEGDYMSYTAFDKNNVYTFNKEYIDNDTIAYIGIATIIEKANPLKFERTDSQWAKDGTYHFYNDKYIEADYTSFEKINWNFAKDSSLTYVRINDKFISFKGDSRTLKTIEDSHNTIDKENVYWISYDDNNKSKLYTISFTEKNKVFYLNNFMVIVENTVYYNGTIIADADAKSFKALGLHYSKDAKNVYYKNNIIENADTNSFKESKGRYEDKNGRYQDGKLED